MNQADYEDQLRRAVITLHVDYALPAHDIQMQVIDAIDDAK